MKSLLVGKIRKLFIVLFVVLCGNFAVAQSVIIRGLVTDATSQIPLANVSVFFNGGGGVRTDSTGHYTLIAARRFVKDTHLQFTYIGYKTASVVIDFSVEKQTVDMQLTSQENSLADVVVGPKRERYRNKDNPAVELIRKVIAHKDENKMGDYDYARYRQYEKMVISVSDFSKKLQDKKFLSKYQFLFKNVDTTKVPGKSLLPLYLEENSSENYYQRDPLNTKQIVTGEHHVDFGEFIDTKGLTKYLKALYADVHIYDNNITLFTNQFLSPIANSAPTFYKFYIRDTIEQDGIKLVRLAFQPRNSADMLFRGTIFVTLDGHYAVQKVRMFSPNGINFNFLRTMSIALDFERQPGGRYLLTNSDIVGDFGIFKKGMGLYGERVVSYKDFRINEKIPQAMFHGEERVVQDSASSRGAAFWAANRFDSLSVAESKTYQNVDSLTRMRSFKRAMDWFTFLFAGYKQTGPAEIGPANTFYSFNPVEGFRLRLGGRTTPKLSKRYYFETYGAYGFGDQKWKYFGSATYSINDKSIYQFPQNYVRVSYQHDTKIPGQELQFVQEDNFLLSFKRGNNDKWLYNDLFKINYVHEFENHFSYDIGYRYWRQLPAGTLGFNRTQGPLGVITPIQSVTTSEFGVTLRYAPHEIFYQGKVYRVPLVGKYPVFSFRYLLGLKGFLGGEYNYHNFDLNIQKRFYLSQLGYTDMTFDAGYILGKVPYPLLALPHANQTYAYQLQSYNLMNFLEFASDHYVSLMADHYFNGFIFNKIPLLKKLKWREVVEGKVLWGGLRDENNPAMTPGQMLFPTTDGQTSTFALSNKPYFEAGFGIANIFKLVRVDYIRRFTYLQHSGIPTSGIRVRVKFDL